MGFKRGFPKIHDNVDVVRVANEMKPCNVEKFVLNIQPPECMGLLCKGLFLQGHAQVKMFLEGFVNEQI